MATVTLIIATYNWPRALECVLASVVRQTRRPDEIVIADDGSDGATRAVIDRFSTAFDRPLHHVWQEDQGFRKSRILNQAIVRSSSDLVIQIDGDVVLHAAFIEDHLRLARQGWFLCGYRIRLSQAQTNCLLAQIPIDFSVLAVGGTALKRLRLPWLAGYWPGNGSIRRGFGHNIAYWRADALAVNGYNEDIVGWGYEDTEFAARLLHLGLRARKVKLACKQYHFWHPDPPEHLREQNHAMLEQALKRRVIRCAKGIVTETASDNPHQALEGWR